MFVDEYKKNRTHRNLLPEDYDQISLRLKRAAVFKYIAQETGWSAFTVAKVAYTRNYNDYRRLNVKYNEARKAANNKPVDTNILKAIFDKYKSH